MCESFAPFKEALQGIIGVGTPLLSNRWFSGNLKAVSTKAEIMEKEFSSKFPCYYGSF